MIQINERGGHISDNVLDNLLSFNSTSTWSAVGTGYGAVDTNIFFEGKGSLKIENTAYKTTDLTVNNTTQSTVIKLDGTYDLSLYLRKTLAEDVSVTVEVYKNGAILYSTPFTFAEAQVDQWFSFCTNENWSLSKGDIITFKFKINQNASSSVTNAVLHIDGMHLYNKERNQLEAPEYRSPLLDLYNLYTGFVNYADTKWGKDLIEVDRYENIPLEVGYYAFLAYDSEAPIYWEIDLKTNAFDYKTDESFSLLSFVNTAQSPFLISKRELITSISDLSNENELLTYFLDTFYDSEGNIIGTSRPQDELPIVKLQLDYFKNRNKKDFYLEQKNKNYIGIITDTISKSNYDNGMFKLYYDFPEYIKINNSHVFLNNKKISNCKVGLIESETENKLGILDYSGNFENYITENQLTIILDYFETTSDKSTKRISKFSNNTNLNVVNLETFNVHSDAMVLTFNEVYGTFPNTIFDANSPNILDFSGGSYKTEVSENNVDFMFSAEGSGISFLRNNYLENSYGIVSVGSNNLIRQDLTDAIDKFPTNYIAVTSRSETDNDGTDPLGTSYGFGVEFNEPTLSADLTGQGLTDWGGSSEHQQSPATAIVAAKLKKIKDATNATWDIVREAARRSASNYGSYNIYRGFGVIDVATAIAQVPNVQKERSLVLAEYWKHATPFNQNLNFEDKSDYTPVVKKDFIDKQSYISGRIGTELSNPTSPQALKFNEFWTDNGGVEYTNSDGKFTFKKAGVYLIKFNAVSQAVGTRIGVKKNQVKTSLADNHAQAYTPVLNGTLMIDMTMEFEKDDFIVFHLISGSIRNLTSDKFGQFSIIKIN